MKARFLFYLRLVCGVILLAWGASTFAAAQPDVVMAIPPDGYPPYIIVDDDGQVGGIMIAVMVSAAEHFEYGLSFELLPENRSLIALNQYKVDARMESPSWTDNPDEYLWSDPVVAINDHFIFHRFEREPFELDQVPQDAQIVTHLGYGYPTLQALFDQKHAVRKDYPTEKSMLERLLFFNNRVKQAAVMDEKVAKWYMSQYAELADQFVTSKKVIDHSDLHLQMMKTKKAAKFLKRFNEHLSTLKRTGDYQRMVTKILNRKLPH